LSVQRRPERRPVNFIGRLREAHGRDKSSDGKSQYFWSQSLDGQAEPAPIPTSCLPREFVDHPDYQVKRELGRGGMGVVYLAHNTLMARDEALKVMGRHIMERPGVLDRFLREIRAVAKLRHPNIVTAYHASRIGESIVFAMEYVEGADLSRLVKAKGPLPVGYACHFIHQAALGLQHAHEEGLVHRDIKPGNLMFSNKGGKVIVKVLDFGLAKATREEKIDSALTYEGQALGTPDFIAPEQILDAPKADIRADIYSLGGTLFYLLTGRPPFVANSVHEVYEAHISRDAGMLNLIRPQVPVEVAALAAKMLAKEPGRRFQTPGEVAESLVPLFEKRSVRFKGPSAEMPGGNMSTASPPTASAVSKPAQPATGAAEPAIQTEKSAASTVAEVRWESLIEFRDSDSPVEAMPTVAQTRRPPWVWASVAVGALTVGLFALWLATGSKVDSWTGTIALGNIPKPSKVPNVPFEQTQPGIREGDGEPLLEGGSKGVEPLVGTNESGESSNERSDKDREKQADGHGERGKKDIQDSPTESPAAVDNQKERPKVNDTANVMESQKPSENGFTPLFNGEDLSGWTFPLGNEADWTVQNGELFGAATGGPSVIASKQSNYRDFHLRIELLRPDDLIKSIFVRSNFYNASNIVWYGISIGGQGPAPEVVPLGKYRIKLGGSVTDAQFLSQEGLRELTSPKMPPLLKDTWYVLEIIAARSRFRMLVDGREVSSFEDTQPRLTNGRIGFWLRPGGGLRIRTIEIKELNGKESAVDNRRHNGIAGRRTPKTSTSPALAQDSFQVGSIWVGEYAVTRSGGTSRRLPVNFRVLERYQSAFRARYEIEGQGLAHHVREITGTIKNGEIYWYAKDVVFHEGHEGQDHAGRIEGDRINLNFRGPALGEAFQGQTAWGTVTLSRHAE
jgi:serine/threonine protein kinase